jgi:hypothetical protein
MKKLGHIILITKLPFFTLTPYCCVITGEAATYTTFIDFGLTRQGIQLTINYTQTITPQRWFVR